MKSKEKEELEYIGFKFKESGKEKEALDYGYLCPNCLTRYEYCDCEKKLKKIIDYSEEIKKLVSQIKITIKAPKSEIRDRFLKELKEYTDYWKKQLENCDKINS